MAEHKREVGFAICHRCQQRFHHAPIAGVASFDANLRGEACMQFGLVDFGERTERSFGFGDRSFRIVVEQREEGFGEAGQIPVADRGLIGKGISSLVIDRAECFRRIVDVHESARTVVDGLA